jgi:hypothetical protein
LEAAAVVVAALVVWPLDFRPFELSGVVVVDMLELLFIDKVSFSSP